MSAELRLVVVWDAEADTYTVERGELDVAIVARHLIAAAGELDDYAAISDAVEDGIEEHMCEVADDVAILCDELVERGSMTRRAWQRLTEVVGEPCHVPDIPRHDRVEAEL